MPSAASPVIPLDAVQRLLVSDIPFLFIAFALIAVALTTAALLIVRRERDPLLLSFALFALLYGGRLWMQRENAAMIFYGTEWFQRVRDSIDYLVPIPAMLFFYLGGFLSWTGKRLALIVSAMGAVLFALTLTLNTRLLFHTINNVAIIVALLQFAYSLSRRRETAEARIVRAGLFTFIALALIDNVRGLMGGRGLHIEPFGFVVFIACLGYVAADRAFAREKRLLVIEQELDIARRIQMSLLPAEFPRNSRLKVAARYLPMTSVAGDLYDFIVAEEERATILVADVSGHGVPAALIASMVKLAAASQREHAAQPARLLSGMNAALVGNTQTQFVTAACASFDLRERRLHYSAAAHPPILRLRGGNVDAIEENGLMLAAFDFAAYEQKALELEPGDRLLMYTDGVVEAANRSGEFFGEARLSETLRAGAALSPDDAADAITDAVRVWSPRQDDDITVVLCDIA